MIMQQRWLSHKSLFFSMPEIVRTGCIYIIYFRKDDFFGGGQQVRIVFSSTSSVGQQVQNGVHTSNKIFTKLNIIRYFCLSKMFMCLSLSMSLVVTLAVELGSNFRSYFKKGQSNSFQNSIFSNFHQSN